MMERFNTGINRNELSTEAPRATRFTVVRPIVALTTSAQTILTVPGNQFFQVGGLRVTNHSGSAADFTIYEVPNGGSVGASTTAYGAISLAANQAVELIEPRYKDMYPAQTTVQALASANNALNIRIWGVLIEGGDPL